MFDKSAKKIIWDKLKEVAMDDGKLTQDERELMATVISDIEKYNETLHKALEDGIIDEREERRLFEGRMQVMEKAYDKAREDLVISEDEKKILKEICKIVREVTE